MTKKNPVDFEDSFDDKELDEFNGKNKDKADEFELMKKPPLKKNKSKNKNKSKKTKTKKKVTIPKKQQKKTYNINEDYISLVLAKKATENVKVPIIERIN